MHTPNAKQWVVIWGAALWIVGSLVAAEEYVWRSVVGASLVAGIAYWHLDVRKRARASRAVLAAAAPAAVGHNTAASDAILGAEVPAVAIPVTSELIPALVGVRGWLA